MDIKQYLKDKKTIVSGKKWDLFSVAKPANTSFLFNPSELYREDKTYCVAGIYNNDKTKVKVGENIYPFNQDTQSITIDGVEYYVTKMHKDSDYDKMRYITFKLYDQITDKKSVIDDLVITKKISAPLSRTMLFPFYNLDKATSRRRRGESCSLATCNGCAKEINDYLHKTLQAKISQQQEGQNNKDEYDIHHF